MEGRREMKSRCCCTACLRKSSASCGLLAWVFTGEDILAACIAEAKAVGPNHLVLLLAESTGGGKPVWRGWCSCVRASRLQVFTSISSACLLRAALEDSLSFALTGFVLI